MQLKYKIYPTLLDAFQYYLTSDNDDALQQMLDKINRVPFTSEAAEKGTAFNELVDILIKAYADCDEATLASFLELPDEAKITHRGFDFKKSIVESFYKKLCQSSTQVFTQATLTTKYGVVLLYGYIDNLLYGCPYDIKTTSSYDFPKYLHNWQHIVYPYCLINGNGVTKDAASIFTYEVTNFNGTFSELYVYKEERDLPKLTAFVERLIEFIEAQKDKITDLKIFALDGQPAPKIQA